jgi:hypothetical protein
MKSGGDQSRFIKTKFEVVLGLLSLRDDSGIFDFVEAGGNDRMFADATDLARRTNAAALETTFRRTERDLATGILTTRQRNFPPIQKPISHVT